MLEEIGKTNNEFAIKMINFLFSSMVSDFWSSNFSDNSLHQNNNRVPWTFKV